MKKMVYIAGPMRGVEWYNYGEFDRHAAWMRKVGYTPVNPADIDRQRPGFWDWLLLASPYGWDWTELPPFLDEDTLVTEMAENLSGCDAIALLPGWEKSKGARAEKALAEVLGLEIMRFAAWTADGEPALISMSDDGPCEPGYFGGCEWCRGSVACDCEDPCGASTDISLDSIASLKALMDENPWPGQDVCYTPFELGWWDEDQAYKRMGATDAPPRKQFPIASGVLDYFPDAIQAVAHCSWVGNEQHNPGEPLHWSRHKSNDHADCMMRHFLERGATDTDGVLHMTKAVWRALALLQMEIENERRGPEQQAPVS